MPALALNHTAFALYARPAPILDQATLTSGLASLQECQRACAVAGGETVGSYGLMACLELLSRCEARCQHAEWMLLEFAEVELGLLRGQLGECAEICDHCARACVHYHDFDLWAECAEATRECAEICRYLLMRLPTVLPRE